MLLLGQNVVHGHVSKYQLVNLHTELSLIGLSTHGCLSTGKSKRFKFKLIASGLL
jgi:hypothetical protein